MTSAFLNTTTFVIDEKITFFDFSKNSYAVYNEKAEKIAQIDQVLNGWQKVLRFFLDKRRLPFLLELKDADNSVLATISRGWTFGMSNIALKDSDGKGIGSIKRKFSLKPTFTIHNSMGNFVAEIKGDYYAWDFTITDHANTLLGTINKKWTGFAKELFTSADKYIVSLTPGNTNPAHRLLIIATSISVDMIMKNNK